ncbi:hypothetical protein [Cytobacillus gottheilii]|uniref:hypothetical protein n=1 Tax=Cytobacillus gottheilii TaxID=859144 RepID=UPI0009BA4C96|nr:hypothetical protein [Cytobacillus gottheilii]
MVTNLKVLCIKTVFNSDDSNKIDYKKGKVYQAEIIGDDILVEDESGDMCLAGLAVKEVVRLGIQEQRNGPWDDWFHAHFEFTGQ